jgi:hypothetical protein
MKKNTLTVLNAADWEILSNYKKHVDNSMRFIPIWVKVAVAMALP